jgi:3-(3-hydroxy-phenyl)propionate hydroxylase
MYHDRYTVEHVLYPYARVADQDAGRAVRHPVVVVGGGPVGLAVALDLGLQGQPVVVLDDHEGAGAGSRAICFSKRSLEIADRLGFGAAMLDKGVVWNKGRVFHRDGEVFAFDLLPEDGHRFPAFVNLQQPYVERFLVDRIRQAQAQGAPIEIRGRNRVTAIDPRPGHTALDIDTPDGAYAMEADWLIACDGAHSPIRKMLGLDFDGRVFRDSFLIADIRMPDGAFPTERWFWFEPPHGSGASTLVHKQPDDVWRVDFQIGWETDREEELKERNIRRRLDAMLAKVDYDIVWSSIYTFQCKRMARFRHGRVLFAGDAAHQVSPFGARGANSGFQDAENLAWKLALVLRGDAPERLLDSYDTERVVAADENILHSTRATDFITPKSPASRVMRDAVLALARDHEFARPLINSGRLSTPCSYDLPGFGPDALDGPTRTRPGSPCPDAPIGDGFLLDRLRGGFTILTVDADAPETVTDGAISAARIAVSANEDPTGALAARYLGAAPGAVYLIRPDQHVVARWPDFDDAAIRAALRMATARPS